MKYLLLYIRLFDKLTLTIKSFLTSYFLNLSTIQQPSSSSTQYSLPLVPSADYSSESGHATGLFLNISVTWFVFVSNLYFPPLSTLLRRSVVLSSLTQLTSPLLP